MAIKTSKMMKVAGLSLAGFAAVSIGVDKANIGPIASQLAGFCGAFVGGWVGSRRRRKQVAQAVPGPEPPAAQGKVTPMAAAPETMNSADDFAIAHEPSQFD